MVTSPPAVPSGAPPCSPDGEPLCLPPQPQELCEAARRRLPQVEAELRRRLSGADRSVEAVELEALLAGVRPIQEAGMAGSDPFLESGVLVLCAAHLLGRPALLPLTESLALRGIRIVRGSLAPDQPPRALELIGPAGLTGPRPIQEHVEVYRASTMGIGPAARTLLAMAGAGLARPVVLIAPEVAQQGQAAQKPSFLYAGLPAELRDTVTRAAAPHPVEDATAPVAPLLAGLAGRNPWQVYRIVQVPWPSTWNGPQLVYKPQLTEAGTELAGQVLRRPPEADEAFALACHALAAAVRLADLTPIPPSVCSGRIPCDAELDGERERLAEALLRLTRRPLLPQQDGEAPLFLRAAYKGGMLLLDAHHPDEMGRLLTPAGGGGYARLRLFHFPKEGPRGLWISGISGAWYVDGGDLRVHVELVPAGSLLRGLPQSG